MVGATVFTALSDRFGRKPPHLGCQFSMAIIGIGCAFAQDYTTFTVLRFLLGMLQQVRKGRSLKGQGCINDVHS
jgi:OCT family organic cation transporter-like MFS transporter 4/5